MKPMRHALTAAAFLLLGSASLSMAQTTTVPPDRAAPVVRGTGHTSKTTTTAPMTADAGGLSGTGGEASQPPNAAGGGGI